MKNTNLNASTATVTTDAHDLALPFASGSMLESLPTVQELLRGCPFLDDDIHADIQAFAKATERQFNAGGYGRDILSSTLTRLKGTPTVMDFLIVANVLQSVDGKLDGDVYSKTEAAARCHFYAAILGDGDSLWKVAAHAVSSAYAPNLSPGVVRAQVAAAVGWLLVATGKLGTPTDWKRETSAAFASSVDARGRGRGMIQRMLQSRELALSGFDLQTLTVTAPLINTYSRRRNRAVDAVPAFASVLTDRAESRQTSPRTIVFKEIGNPNGSDDCRTEAEFQALIGEPLALAPIPDLTNVRQELLGAFPHAKSVISAVLDALAGLTHVMLPPTILVGPPESGKTLFSEMFAQVMKIPCEIYPCAGAGSAAFAGTSRLSATGKPSVPVSVISKHRHASPVIVLDELDKADNSRTNGSLPEALLGFLDSRTAASWRDPYLEAPVDLSHVIWMGTANRCQDIPRALQDRCQVIAFPAAHPKHLELLVPNILRRLMMAKGLDPRWTTSLNRTELKFVRANWQTGSLRHLARLLESVLATRERFHVVH